MQFSIPQFIDIEDKIIGPLTLKQFLWLLAGGSCLFVLWTLLPFGWFILAGLPVGGFFAGLAFYKYNGRPLSALISSMLAYLRKPKLYLFSKKKGARPSTITKDKPKRAQKPKAKKKPNLEEIAWRLDVE